MDMSKIMAKKMQEIKKRQKGEMQEIVEIEVSKLKENPYQPRIEIKAKDVIELAKSIEKSGLLQPINVYQSPLGDYYIISGHRRVEAHKLLGKEKIKAIVYKNQDDLKLASKAIVENLQREDLNIIELALSLKRYKEEFGKTMEEIAEDIGKSKGYVSQILNILKLPEKVIKDIKENKTTKDVTALNWINSFANKLKQKFSTLNKSHNPHEYEVLKEEFSQIWENEVFDVYKGFLENGREWLKNEIEKRLEKYKRQIKKSVPTVEIKQTKKHGLTIKVNEQLSLTDDEVNFLKDEINKIIEKIKKERIKKVEQITENFDTNS